VPTAKSSDGLRLILHAGVPGPWSEAAKALFVHHGVAFLPVAQKAGQANEDWLPGLGIEMHPLRSGGMSRQERAGSSL